MKKLLLDCLMDFECIGSDCPETCCGGWGIIIDDETAKYYRSVEGEFGDKLRKYIVNDGERDIIDLLPDGSCPFLDCNKLCEVYKNLGKDKMSGTCSIYPRVLWTRGEMQFNGLYVSCPEVARKVLLKQEGLEFHIAEDDVIPDDVNWDIYNRQINTYVTSMEIVQDRSMPFSKRLSLLAMYYNELHCSEKNSYKEIGNRYLAVKSDVINDTSDIQVNTADIARRFKAYMSFTEEHKKLDYTKVYADKVNALGDDAFCFCLADILNDERLSLVFENFCAYYLAIHHMVKSENEEYSKTINEIIFLCTVLSTYIGALSKEQTLTDEELILMFSRICREYEHNNKKVIETTTACLGFDVDNNLLKMLTLLSDNKQNIEFAPDTILVLTGEGLCYGVLDRFAMNFGNALANCGANVSVIEVNSLAEEDIFDLSRNTFKAIVGFQTEFFVRKLSNGDIAGNLFDCPKFQWTFDHPLFFSYYLLAPVKNAYVLSQDEYYANYAKEFFPYINEAWHVSPAGEEANVAYADRAYDLSFVGTFNDFRERLDAIKNLPRDERRIALRLLNELKKNSYLTVEEALLNVLAYYDIVLEDAHRFVVLMNHMKDVVRVIMFYTREKVVKAILDAGIKLDVFSNTWSNKIFAGYDNLIVHGDVDYDGGLEVFANSKMSLNIMSWHKGGMTERVANIMANGAVCVTDKSSYISRNYENNKDMLIYDLDNLSELTKGIKNYLADASLLTNVSTNGKTKALEYENWNARAIDFLNICSEICGEDESSVGYADYYQMAGSYVENNLLGDAYYNYKYSIYLLNKSIEASPEDEGLKADLDVVSEEFKVFCELANPTEYELGKGLEILISNLMAINQLEFAKEFLGIQLFDNNRVAAKMALTEENMLLFIMLEIALCEKKRRINPNICERYDSVSEFKQDYNEIKRISRRIWFGVEVNDISVLKKYTSDMIAVIFKYSVSENYWIDAFEQMINLLRAADMWGMATGIELYKDMIEDIVDKEKQKACMDGVACNNAIHVRVDMNAPAELIKKATGNKWAVIFCTNDEEYEAECIAYLKRLEIPEGYDLEIISVWNAPSMAAGYNYACSCTDAKYKLYIHHDTFVIKSDCLIQMTEAFKDDELGMLGIFGAMDLADSALWYKSSWENSRLNLYQDAILNILESKSDCVKEKIEYAHAIDGVFIATSKDIPWREDIFDGWHYYDISQSFELRKAGFKTGFISDEEGVWVLHESTLKKDPEDRYGHYREIFINNYM